MRKYLTPLVGVTATVIALTGCSSSKTPPAHQTQQSPVTDTESDTPQDSAQSATQDTTHEFLDVLYSEELHTDVQPAAPGTAYIEVAGERFEFSDLTCTISEQPGREQFIVAAGQETTGAGHQLTLSRQIGADIGFSFEEEHVQLSLLVTQDGTEKMSNTMAQHEREQGQPAQWIHGSGTAPLIHVVERQATARGVVAGVPHAPISTDSEFVAAATCPDQ